MIIDNEKVIEIVGILAISDIDVDDCKKITNFIVELFHENQELKEQLELYENDVYYSSELDKKDKEIEKLKNQQKEYIEWLEKESKELIRDAGYHQRICLDILEKYKEIIGGKDE